MKVKKYKKWLLTIVFIVISAFVISFSLRFHEFHQAELARILNLNKISRDFTRIMEKYGFTNYTPEKQLVKLLYDEIDLYRQSPLFKEGFDRLQLMKPMFERIFTEIGVNPDYMYLPFVESFYLDNAFNDSSGARGMWQFIPETAQFFGLQVNPIVDERLDPEKSTRAAAKYIKYLENIYGKNAFIIIASAYNAGPGYMSWVLPDFNTNASGVDLWKLYNNDNVPYQTKMYVLRIFTFILLTEILLNNMEAKPLFADVKIENLLIDLHYLMPLNPRFAGLPMPVIF